MGIENMNVATCDRCGKESHYEARSADARAECRDSWAAVWSEAVTPVDARVPRSFHQIVCCDCLTHEEKDRLERATFAVQYEETFPFEP